MRPRAAISERSTGRGALWRALKWTSIGVAVLALILALLYVEEDRRGKRNWETTRRHLAARGIELDWRKLAPAPVDDADNFATTPFLAALFDYLPGTYTPRDLQAYNRVAGFAQTEPPYAEQRGPGDPPPPMVRGEHVDLADALARLRKAQHIAGAVPAAPGRAELANAVIDALEPYRPVLDELRGASRRRQARFNVDYAVDYPWRVSQPHLPVLKRVSRVLLWRASAELALRNSGAASQDATLEIALAGALEPEPLLSSWSARNIILFNARQIIWEGLAAHQWSDEQLADFQQRLAQFAIQDTQRLLAFERAFCNALFEFAHQEPKMVRGWTFGPTLSDKFHAAVLHHMPAGWMFLEQGAYQRSFDELIMPAFDTEAGRIRPWLAGQALHPPSQVLRHRLLAVWASRSLYLLQTSALAQTGINQAIIACALERHRLRSGALPEKLDALALNFSGSLPLDVITGKPMKYRASADGQFILYSVGWNEQDDDGKVVLNQQGNGTDPDKGDWVWPAYSRD